MCVKNSNNTDMCKIKVKSYPFFPHSLTVTSNNLIISRITNYFLSIYKYVWIRHTYIHITNNYYITELYIHIYHLYNQENN